MSILRLEHLALSGGGFADFHAGVNFALTEFSEVGLPLYGVLGEVQRSVTRAAYRGSKRVEELLETFGGFHLSVIGRKKVFRDRASSIIIKNNV